jgi:sulfatase modifying factor 1
VPVTNPVTTLRLYDLSPPSGMAFVPAGSFTMGDTFREGYNDELPLHTVNVSAFYMDKYLVTKALWDDVYDWAIAHGYSFDYAGSGKAADHPAHAMDWYDAVKWCNARSQKEGLIASYYTDSSHSTLYTTGQLNLTNACVNWTASGYRLPTEAEWEKAARGGASGHRFPWADADTITHDRANYVSDSSLAYDISPTRGVHPTFNDGVIPYTSPVGYFAANGYGLYDMAGNMWEWCWDWYDGNWYSKAGATQKDTRGPDGILTLREVRGGSWSNPANEGSRCADRQGHNNPYVYINGGFRCVRGL